MVRINGSPIYDTYYDTGSNGIKERKCREDKTISICLNCPKSRCRYGECELIGKKKSPSKAGTSNGQIIKE